MSQSLILIDELSSACWEKETTTTKKRSDHGGFFYQGPDTPCWLCHAGFLWLLGAIKG
jgi:hypothetical protein